MGFDTLEINLVSLYYVSKQAGAELCQALACRELIWFGRFYIVGLVL